MKNFVSHPLQIRQSLICVHLCPSVVVLGSPGSVARVEPDLNIGARLVSNCLRLPEQASKDARCLQSLLQDYGALAFVHELAAVDHQPPASGADTGIALAGLVP